MALPTDKREFESWRRALAAEELTPEQLKVLQDIVDSGQSKNIESAAQMLDWQDGVIDPDEHMYGV